MARRGRKRRLGLESEYWPLSLLERRRMATLRREGLGVRAIAELLGRAASTVSRELRRNTSAHDRGYDADLAHARARERARRPRQARLLADSDLRSQVQAKLELEWSPEQIAAYLRCAWPHRRSWRVCHETIYQALYRGRAGLSRALTRRLRTGRPVRKWRRRPQQRTGRFVSPAKLIDQRPAVVQARTGLGIRPRHSRTPTIRVWTRSATPNSSPPTRLIRAWWPVHRCG